MIKHNYRVERHMQGDKAYAPGDQRELPPGQAAHLVRSGALTDLGPVGAKAEGASANAAEPEPEAKVEPPVENKVEAPVQNSAEPEPPADKKAPKS